MSIYDFAEKLQGMGLEVTAVLRKTISQKESHPSTAVGLFSRITPQNYRQNTRAARKRQHLKSLKIRPHATKPIDIVLRRTAGTGGSALCSPVMMLFSR